MDGVVFDVRNNTGGNLTNAMHVIDYLCPVGPYRKPAEQGRNRHHAGDLRRQRGGAAHGGAGGTATPPTRRSCLPHPFGNLKRTRRRYAHSGQGYHPVPSGGSFRRLGIFVCGGPAAEQERSHLQRTGISPDVEASLRRGGGEFLQLHRGYRIRRSCARLKWWIRLRAATTSRPAWSRHRAARLRRRAARSSSLQSEPAGTDASSAEPAA